MLGITTTNARVGGFRGGVSAEAKTIYNRIIADGGVSNLSRLNFFVKGLKAIYGDLANVPVCYDAHWIGYKLGSGTGATAGQAAAKLYSLTVAGDAVQSTAASQPLLLAHNGDNYYIGSGVNGNGCTTTLTNYVFPTTQGYTAEAKLSLTSLSNGPIIGKDSGSGAGRVLSLGYNGSFYVTFGLNGLYYVPASVTTANTFSGWIKVKVYTSGADMKVLFSTNTGSGYVQLGTEITVIGGGNSITTGQSGYQANCNLPTAANSNIIKLFRAIVYDSNDNTVVDFNPATYNAATSQTQWTSATGEIWTISTGTAATGYKGTLVDRVIVQGDGVDDQLKTTSVSITTSSRYSAINPFVLTSGYMIAGLNGGTGDRQLTYLSGTTLREYSLGSQINYSGFVASKLQIFQSTYNGASSQVSVNNANNVTGTLTADVIDTLVLFSNLSSAYKNMTLNTLVIPSVIDNATTRTATYNLLKTLNNL